LISKGKPLAFVLPLDQSGLTLLFPSMPPVALHRLGRQPLEGDLKGFVHVKQTTLNFDFEIDSVSLFNDAGGFWQLIQTSNLVLTPK
jgi:hypothetical protein